MILGTEERNPASSTLHIVHRVGELSAIYRYEICCLIVVRDVYNFAGYTTGDVDGKCIISLLDEETFGVVVDLFSKGEILWCRIRGGRWDHFVQYRLDFHYSATSEGDVYHHPHHQPNQQ